ncbi:MAG: LysM peptidoglycan-binding domain-containing protein, partial [Pseudohongiellaceae bacterium]
IRADLRVLATGKRTGLTASQQRILALWPDDVSNQTLRAAASNVRWQLGQSNRFLGGLQRSGAYRDHINRVITEKNLPPELVVLPHVESSFNPSAFSSVSAAGMWQFTRATGQRFMRIDHIVDERMDPYIAANAAMSLLEYNYSVLGTWPLALTAYNHGAGGIARAVRQTGTTDIETIVANYRGRAFGFASRNFYAQFLAVLEVEKNAEQYFSDVRFDPAPEFVEVRTDAFIDAEIFARSLGISLEQLRADNRALRPVVWEGGKRIPRGFPMKVRRQFARSGNLLAEIPNDYKFAVQTPDIAYVVERGDSLSVIARRFNTSVGELVSLNQLASRNRIQIGQRLLLPQDNVNAQQLVEAEERAMEDGVYTVRRGDTVSLIAARYGLTEQRLLGINGIQDRHRIYPGQELRLPGIGDEGASLAVIDGNLRPTPPTEVQFADEAVEVEVQNAGDDNEAVVITPVPEVPETDDPETSGARDADASPEQLALVDELLPPAAVLPDNQEMEAPVTTAEGEAVALDPELDVTESNEQLTEL